MGSVVIDLEMCYVSRENKELYPCRCEIIQIGAVLLGDKHKKMDSFKSLVRPRYGRVDGFIEKLTGISPADTDSAPELAEVLTAFAQWLPEDAVLVAWSDNDERQLRLEMEAKDLYIPALSQRWNCWVDCQRSFADRMNTHKNYNLTEALIIADIPAIDGEHDALVDAENTARLFARLQSGEELKLNSCYIAPEYRKPSTYNPFAALLANYRLSTC